MHRRRAIRIPLVALVATVFGLGALCGGVAWAAFTSAATASQTFATLQLGNPASATATITASSASACTSVTVAWPAAASADTYRVQVRENGGAWGDLVTETGAVTSYVDATTHTHADVDYRVYSRDASSDWEGATPAATSTITCGVAAIDDASATNPCSSSTITWSAPNGANRYDVRRRVNGGSWSANLVSDQLARTYSDPTVHALGAVVEYQVRPGTATVDGTWSSSATIASWTPFRVQSIVVANSATLGTLNAGDTISIAFSKPVLASSLTSTSVRADNGGADRGFYPGSTASTTAGPGKSAFSSFGATANYAGTVGWSNANATWTWTSSVAGTTMTAALANEAFTVGTGPRCAADSSALVGTNQPTSSGRW
jgi:hypothetical protein